mmetsp:Transcript_10661/g.17602  ORF Transcript_10661/g.17602 Transcript_10661/m.17602 type:complete len:193 (+) Transcript_10661:83-661(+)
MMMIQPRAASLLVVFFYFGGSASAFSAGPGSTGQPQSSFNNNEPPPPLPSTTTPYEVLGFDSFPKDFAVIQRRYRELAREYHPDRLVGPDATAEEREIANTNFQRINEAYDTLKTRQDEEEIEVIMMGGNGKRERKVKYKTSTEIREKNPNRVNYDRIVENQKRQNVKAESWIDRGIEYGRHNGDFGPVRRW